jgi:glycerol-1-phosphate dehydrogenase [NAD(P)+]
MNKERIGSALQDATDTRDVVIGSGVLGSVGDILGRSFADRPAVVVADEHTWRAAGRQVQQHLKAAGRTMPEPYLFPPNTFVYAEYANVEKLREALGGHDAIPVAVGSGSLNDLVKRAAHELERPYMNVATAASMDGYTAFGASIIRDGYKQTMTCPAPRAVVADLEVLARAPASMTASGYADLLGKVTAGADWLVADALGVEPIDPKIWSLVQGPLREATGRPAELAAGDQQAMERLIEGLVMSGLAMQAHASSRPGSGSEHQFSHLWEMEGLGLDRQPPLSHGFKVGVGSIAVAALYERLLERDLGALDIEALRSAWPTPQAVEQAVRAAHTTPGLDEAAVKEALAKHIDADRLAQRLVRLRERWSALRRRLTEQLIPAERLRAMLRAAGCPTGPAEIGLHRSAFQETYQRAQMIRRRYTVLDLATETGILRECVDELFAPAASGPRTPPREHRFETVPPTRPHWVDPTPPCEDRGLSGLARAPSRAPSTGPGSQNRRWSTRNTGCRVSRTAAEVESTCTVSPSRRETPASEYMWAASVAATGSIAGRGPRRPPPGRSVDARAGPRPR